MKLPDKPEIHQFLNIPKLLMSVFDDQAFFFILPQVAATDQTVTEKRTQPFLQQEHINIQLTLLLFLKRLGGVFFLKLLEIKDANPPD